MKIEIEVKSWLYNWLKAQERGGFNISRQIVRALINYYHLSPPNIKEIEAKIKAWEQKRE